MDTDTDTDTDTELPAAEQPALEEPPAADPPVVEPAKPRRKRRRRIPAATTGILAALLLGVLADLLVLGQVRHHRDQQIAYADFRESLAKATAPVAPTGDDGKLLPLGTPVAVLEIPKLGLTEVIREGTTSGVLRSGPGHRRDTVLPGQIGISVVMGRQTAYGGPFRRIKELRAGDTFTVTTGQGRHFYKVLGPRRPGDPVPPPQQRADNKSPSRLTLVTAEGSPLVPSRILRVDADLDADRLQPSNPKLTPRPVLVSKDLPASEEPMGTDSAAWIFVVLWGQALVAAALLTAWMLRRWGRWQTWIVAVPVIAALGLTLTDQIARLLPNLL